MGIVYAIVNKINGAQYVGSTIGDGRSRWVRHKKDLKNNSHHSKYLQRAYNKYGKDVFEFNILESVDNNILLQVEQKYLDIRKNQYSRHLNYNMIWTAGNCSGREVSQKTRNKISKSQIGKTIPHEVRDKISNSWEIKGNYKYSLISPTGLTINFGNIRKFCRDYDLEHNSIRQLLLGNIYYYKGWIKDYTHSYSFISPDGIIFNNIINLTKFCNEHNLKMKGMSKLHRGCLKSYYGWKLLKSK